MLELFLNSKLDPLNSLQRLEAITTVWSPKCLPRKRKDVTCQRSPILLAILKEHRKNAAKQRGISSLFFRAPALRWKQSTLILVSLEGRGLSDGGCLRGLDDHTPPLLLMDCGLLGAVSSRPIPAQAYGRGQRAERRPEAVGS